MEPLNGHFILTLLLVLIAVCSVLALNLPVVEGYSNEEAQSDETQKVMKNSEQERKSPYIDVRSRAEGIHSGYPHIGLYKGNEDKLKFVDDDKNTYATLHSTDQGLEAEGKFRLGTDEIQFGSDNRITTDPLTFHDKTIMSKLCFDDECLEHNNVERMKHPIPTFNSVHGKAQEYLMNGNFQSKVNQSVFGDSNVNNKKLKDSVGKVRQLRNVFEASTIRYNFSKDGVPNDMQIKNSSLNFGMNRGPKPGLGGAFSDNTGVLADLSPSELSGGKQIINLSIQYYELPKSHGAGIELLNPNGQIVSGAGTSNPQYTTYKSGHIASGRTYRQWVSINMRFDWANSTITIEFLINNSPQASKAERVDPNDSIQTIRFINNASWIGGGSSFYHTWDNLTITTESGSMDKGKISRMGMVSNNLTPDNSTISSANNSLHIDRRNSAPYPVLQSDNENTLMYQAPGQFTVSPNANFTNEVQTPQINAPDVVSKHDNSQGVAMQKPETLVQGKQSVTLNSGANTVRAEANKVSLDNSPQLCIGSKSTCVSKDQLKKVIDYIKGFTVETNTITVYGDDPNSYQNVPITKQFDNPVVIMKPMTRPGGNHGHIRLKNGMQQNINRDKVGISVKGPIHLRRNNKIGTMYGTQEYEVSFDILPRATYGNTWESILHFTETGDNGGVQGDRVPGIWFHHSDTSSLHIKTSIGTAGAWGADANYGPGRTQEIPMGTTTNVRVIVAQQRMQTYINNNLIDDRPAETPYVPVNKITVYAGDPWYPPANAVLYNVQYKPRTQIVGQTFNRKTFQCRVEEWLGEDDRNHVPVKASYMIMDEGVHALKNGALVQVGKFITNHNWKKIAFKQKFNQTPIVFTQSQTRNSDHAITTRNTNVSKEGFYTRLQEAEGQDGSHATEEIGYIAIEPSQGTMGEIEYKCGRTGNSVNHNYHRINFGGYYGSGVVLDMQTIHGGNTADLRRTESNGYGVAVRVEEETSRDGETGHVNEVLGWIAWRTSSEGYKPTGMPITYNLSKGKLNYKLYLNTGYWGGKYNAGLNSREHMDKAIKEYGQPDKEGMHEAPIGIRAHTNNENPPYQKIEKAAPYVPGGRNNEGYLLELNGYLTVPKTGYYQFSIDGDDAVDFHIEDKVVASWYGNHWFRWKLNDTWTTREVVYLEKQKAYHIRARYHEVGGDAGINVAWKIPQTNNFELIPADYYFA